MKKRWNQKPAKEEPYRRDPSPTKIENFLMPGRSPRSPDFPMTESRAASEVICPRHVPPEVCGIFCFSIEQGGSLNYPSP